MLKIIIINLLFITECVSTLHNTYNTKIIPDTHQSVILGKSLPTPTFPTFNTATHTFPSGGIFTMKFVSSKHSGGKYPPISASCIRDLCVQVALKSTMALGLHFLPGFSEMLQETRITYQHSSSLTLGVKVNVTGYCDPSATCSLAAKLVNNVGPIVCKVGTFYQKGPTQFVPYTIPVTTTTQLIPTTTTTIIPPSPPPATERWTFIPNKNRVIRTFSFVDQCGGVGENMLSPDQKILFTFTSSISNVSNYMNNSNLVIHALSSNNGKEQWNFSISGNSNTFKGKLFVSPTNHYLAYSYSNGNNTLIVHSLHINNGSLAWNKTIFGNEYYNVNYISLFRTVSNNNPNEDRIIIGAPSSNYYYKIVSYNLSTGNSNMDFFASGNVYFTTNLKSIMYNTGDGTFSNINSNWILNGSKRVLNIQSSINCNGQSVIGADSSFIVINCGSSCHINCPCQSQISFYSLKTGQNRGGVQQCYDSLKWIQSIGGGHILYKYFSENTYTINSITDNITNYGSWTIPTDSTDNFLPIIFLPKKNLVIFTIRGGQPNVGPLASSLTAIWMNNGTTAWSHIFNWSVVKSTGYESHFNVGSCGSGIYSLNQDDTLIVIDSHYNGHAISLLNGTELFNILLKLTPDSYTNPYPSPNTLSVVSNDAKTIYSLMPSNTINNGYIKAFYV